MTWKTDVLEEEIAHAVASAAAAIIVGIGVVTLFVCCWVGGGGIPTPVDVATYADAQRACVADAATREAADACRAASRAKYCQRFPDAANCHDMREGGIADGP